MNKKHILLFFLCAFLFFNSFVQLSVNQLSDVGKVNVPIYNISNGQVSASVSFSYSGTGIKLSDLGGMGLAD